MARVTVEDCVIKVPNRFELVMLAAQRARNISAGAPLTIERDNDKNPVVALRELADSTIDITEIENAIIKGMQKHVEMDDPEEDEIDFDAVQQEIAGDAQETGGKSKPQAVAKEPVSGSFADIVEGTPEPVET